MQRFIFQVIEPFINKEIQQQRRQQHLRKIAEQLRFFMKGELIPINKELSKKTRELFVASSDNQKYKENIDFLEREVGKLRQESASKDNQNFKQRMAFDKEKKQYIEEIDGLKKETKKITKKFETDMENLKDQHKEKMIDLKRQHKNELEKRLNDQTNHWQTEINTLKQSYFQQKNHIIQENSKDKSKLIKKYEEKIYALKCESQDQMQAKDKDFTAKIDAIKKAKSDLQYKLSSQQQTIRRLTLQVDIQTSHHRSFKSQFQTTFRELEQSRKRNLQDRQGLNSDYQNLKIRMKQQDKNLNDRIKSLQQQLKETAEQKDKLFTDTIQTLKTDHRIQVQSMYNNMLEERQIALTNAEVKHFEEMFQQMKKYQLLQINYVNLEDQYTNVKKNFEEKISKLQNEHDEQLSSVIERKSYEYQLSGENSKREYNNLQSKFTLQLRALKTQQSLQIQALVKKSQQQKAALSNKLIGQYQAMLADQRTNAQIQIKQKLLQFQRKAKTYQKRIAEGEKRKSQLKVTIQRMKLQSQMKIDSMMQVNQKLQSQIQSLHERILQLQKLKSSIVNDYQFQLLLVKNEMDKLKQEFYQRQDELRANLNEKIIVKNKQISRFAQRIKQETQELMKKNRDRVIAIQKQYEELKRVLGQKTSLPQDIEALRVFHDAYLQRQNQLKGQRKKREQLQRQLLSKDAIQKVFATKQAFKRLTVIDKFASTSSKFIFNKQP